MTQELREVAEEISNEIATEEVEAEAEAQEEVAEEAAESAAEAEAEPEEVELSIGEPESPAGDDEVEDETPAIRQMRKALKDRERKERELKRELERLKADKEQSAPAAVPELGPRPRIDDPDIDYDQDKLDAALDAWDQKREQRNALLRQKEQAEEEAKKQHQQILDRYEAAKRQLPVNRERFAEAEKEVIESFSPVQQTVLLRSKVPEKLVYVLGRNPRMLDELAQMNDPVELAFELGRLEKDLKVTPRKKPAPPPEEKPNGGSPSLSVEQQLDRLRDEAARTGNADKLMAFKRKLKQQSHGV